MSRQVVLNVPAIYQGNLPPMIDAPWLARGVNPLGSTALGSTVTADFSVLKLALDIGFTVSSVTPG